MPTNQAPVSSCRSETWLLLSTKPVDLRRLWTEGAGTSTVTTASIIYSPTRQLKTTQPSERIATTAVELAEMIAATAADRILCIEDAHHLDHSHDVHHQVPSQIPAMDKLQQFVRAAGISMISTLRIGMNGGMCDQRDTTANGSSDRQ